MAATVLNSPIAARMGIFMVRAFVQMRRELVGQDHISKKLAEIDKTLLIHDEGLRDLYQKQYWEGEIVATCDNFMAFPSKTISRYKSVSKKS